MFATDQQTAVSSLPTPAIAGTPGYFTGGNPATGQAATILDADWLNMVQEELLNILEAADITPSKTTYNQVLASLQKLFAPSSSVGSYPDASVLGAPTTLTASEAGQAFTTNSYPVVLPLFSTAWAGAAFRIINGGSTATTVSVQGVDKLWTPSNGAATLVTLNPGESAVFIATTVQWQLFGGSVLTRLSGQLGGYSYASILSAPTTLTATQLGQAFTSNGQNVVLPLFSAVWSGASVRIINAGTVPITVSTQGTDKLWTPSGGSSGASSVTLNPDESGLFIVTTSQWQLFGGSVLTRLSGQLGSYASGVIVGANTTLTALQAGQAFTSNGFNFVLPAFSTVQPGAAFRLVNAGVAAITVTLQGSDKIWTPTAGSNGTSVSLNPGETALIIATTAQWQLFDGSVFSRMSSIFSSSLTTNGYKKYPDPASPTGYFIMQWGSVVVPGNGTASVTFPIAFPNACLQVIPSIFTTPGSPSTGWAGAGGIAASGFSMSSMSAAGTTNPNSVSTNYIAIGY